ncbi:MAG: hypothetical protein KDC46_03605 [Thermoleophilia bacterium]|nr:hypothetical protein [Thermoleophilia bacterium]
MTSPRPTLLIRRSTTTTTTARASAALALLVLLAGCVLAPARAHAATEVMYLDDPITDNYKASYNADPSAPERRTWLSMRSVTAAGTTWRPAEPGSIVVTSGGSVAVTGSDGRSATLTFATASGPVGTPLVRVDPTGAQSGGRWGPLVTVTDQATLRGTPGVLEFTLASGGATLATGSVSYRYDSQLANVASDHIEYNGPGGRWWVGATRTRTNWEPEPATPPSLRAAPAGSTGTGARPRITRIWLPLRTSRRHVTLRVRGRNAGGVRITRIRVRIDGRRWGRWISTRSRYTLDLGRGRRTHAVRIQLRDARGRTSAVSRRRITCSC